MRISTGLEQGALPQHGECTEEYRVARRHWLDLLLQCVSAPDDERDDLFETAMMVYIHMIAAEG